MALNNVLEALVGHSSNVASVKLAQPSKDVANYLLNTQSRDKQLIRDAESYEGKLFSVGGSEQAVARIQAEYSSPALNSKATHRQHVDRVLSAANTLNQICDNPVETRERIQELAQKHEELQLNIDYLESSKLKNDRELLTLQQPQTQPKKSSKYKDEDEERNAQQLQHDITEHERAILRLQKSLSAKDAMITELADGITEQLEVQSRFKDTDITMYDVDDMNFEYTDMTEEAMNDLPAEERELALLQKAINDKKEELEQAEETLKSLPTESTISHSPIEHDVALHTASMEVYDKFVETWDHASVSMRSKSTSIVDEDLQNGVIALTERIASTLQDVIDDLQVVQSLDSHITILGDVNQTLINFILDQAKPSFNKNSRPTFQPTAQSASSAAVLKTIREHQMHHHRGIPLAQLKTGISKFASSLNFSEAQGTQAIYMLVANGLVTIDRNEKGSPVKLV
ncbi:hypothetical protein INT43_008359 [Umbelopsis isabellina]|uniref:Uncharacterized protein n=1 Tax=Mortierella isabellina TaxID=91625 RepID=A0A8H7PD26_MORIS|nr:hypothetical protein INT43_008359 [Umbelopsis isabellina]